jgi:hypothetical protein
MKNRMRSEQFALYSKKKKIEIFSKFLTIRVFKH